MMGGWEMVDGRGWDGDMMGVRVGESVVGGARVGDMGVGEMMGL